jgi:uncharacterized membrane protein YdbT with pleckstrin-like domain
MSGHPHWRGETPSDPGLSGFMIAPAENPGRARAPSRRGLLLFAAVLSLALGTVMTIAASSVQAMSQAAAFSEKSDSWVGLAAISSVLICAFLGVVIVHRYTSSGRR